jgi:uncharacterized protein
MHQRLLLKELQEWKASPYRKPLVLQGARQVGKTTLVNDFGKIYDQYLYLNLEKDVHQKYFKKIDNTEELVQRIFFDHKLKWSKIENTLLFIDEIQEFPAAVNFLRYFFEELPQLHVIAAGSMLEALLGKKVSFPVGRVEFKVLRPFSFQEFLLAINEEEALTEYKTIPINKYATQRLFSLFHTYAFLGGMPEIIKKYAVSRDITNLFTVYQSLINSYFIDAEKYADSKSSLELLRLIIQKVLVEAGNRITNKTFGGQEYKTKDVEATLRAIQKTHLIQLVYPTVDFTPPALPDYKKSPRLQLLDTGILNFASSAHNEILATNDLNQVFKGRIIEHLVGQELLSSITYPLGSLHFWIRDKNGSSAELDFLLPYKGKLIPVEVKSGPTGTLKSLMVFLDHSPLNFGIRLYHGEISIDKIKTSSGKPIYLFNFPYFLAAQIENYIPWILNQLAELDKERFEVREAFVAYGDSATKTKKSKILKIENLKAKHYKILQSLANHPRSGKDLLEEVIGLSDQSKNRHAYIKSLMDLGLLEWTEPENIISKTQAYQLTEKGRFLMDQRQVQNQQH